MESILYTVTRRSRGAAGRSYSRTRPLYTPHTNTQNIHDTIPTQPEKPKWRKCKMKKMENKL